MKNNRQYTVKQLAQLAGVSVRTLHLYDRMGLLKPAVRTEARYRLYGEAELLRLQQILFYKELDLPLQDIAEIMDDPDFDLVHALENHKKALRHKGERIKTLLLTIDKTIQHLKGGTMLTHEELYEGLPKEKAEAWRKEAIEKYGTEKVNRSEEALQKMGKDGFEKLKTATNEVWQKLMSMQNEDPVSAPVQREIDRHYHCIRQFWGTVGLEDRQAESYKGLGELYVSDERFTMTDGKPNPRFALFMQQAMTYYADNQLV